MKHHKTVIIGQFYWDVKSRLLYRTHYDSNDLEKSTITLTPKQHRLLLCLYNAHPGILQRNEIINFVWESKPTCPESLPQLINRTRMALEDVNKNILLNEPGVGYSLNFSVREELQTTQGLNSTDMPSQKQLVNNIDKNSLFRKNLILPLLIVLTAFHFGSAIEAFFYAQKFKSAFFSEPYPYTKQISNNLISVVIDNNECNYTKNTQLLKCQ